MTELHTSLEPTLTRRRLVAAGGASAAALYLMGGLPGAALAAITPAYLRRASYTGRTGAAFSAISATGARVTLRLLAVADLVRAKQTPSLAGRDDAFALTFSGPVGQPMGSGIRSLYHPTLGWVSLFISPAGAAASNVQRYEVVVDRAPAR